MIFHRQAISRSCAKALEFLRTQPILQGYYLAGGTGLALQLGHRISTDLDWFSQNHRLDFAERNALRSALASSGGFAIRSEEDGQFYGRLLGTDVSFLHLHHGLLEPTIDFDGVALATPLDIGLMKLAAINS